MKKLTLAGGLLIGYLLVAVLPLFGLGWFALDHFERALVETVNRNVASVADRKSAQINDFMDEILRDIRITAGQDNVRQAIQQIGAGYRRGGQKGADAAAGNFLGDFVAFNLESERFYDLLLIDRDGNVVFSIRREDDLGKNLHQGELSQSSLGLAYARAATSLTIEAGPFLDYPPSGNVVAGFVVAPVFEHGVPVGALAVQVNFSAFGQVFSDRIGLGRSGQIEVIRRDQQGQLALTHFPPGEGGRPALSPALLQDATLRAARGEYGGRLLGPDGERQRIVAAWRYVPAIASGLTVAIDADEVLAPAATARRLTLASLGLMLFLATLLALFVGRRILRAEDRLAFREAQYRSIFQSINDGVLIFRASGGGQDFSLVDLNPAAQRLLQYSRDEALAGPLAELLPALDSLGLCAALSRVKATRQDEALPLLQYQDQRLSIWVEGDFHPLRNGDVLLVLKDMTERKLAEDKVARSLSLLNEAQRIAKVGSWTLDLRSNRLEWSDQIFRIFEIDRQKFSATYEGFLERVHPEDRNYVNRAFANSLATRQPYDITHRLLLADGRVIYVRERCETEFGEFGTPLVAHGTVQDITDQREAEADRMLYVRAFEQSGEAMLITDAQEKILAVNRAFTRFTGYQPAEVLGWTPNILASGRTPRRVYQDMWQSLNGSGFWQGEIWDRRKDGTVYPKWLSISEVRDAAGARTHFVGSFLDTSERKASEEQINRLAHYDNLTGLFNRTSLDSRLDHAVLSARRDGTRLAVMFIDLDRFKNINDSLGHHVGDELLRLVAQRLNGNVRESDIVARLGGDEFVIVLSGLDEPVAAAAVAEKIVRSLGEPYTVGGRELRTSPSVGIAIFPNDGQDPASLMMSADTAMYHAKQQGRNGFQFFSAAMSADAEDRLALEHELHGALSNQEFVVHYQPQVCARHGRLIGFEALVRWLHPQRGLIPPLKFIPLAEETGIIGEIGSWVLREACRQLAAWRAEGFAAEVRMAVNLSAHQLRSPALVDEVRAALADFGLGEGDLELEVTESAAMQNPDQAIGQLRVLRELGVHLAIDDFGTGYSSLAYLKLLPIHVLKLDRAFVRDIELDENDAAISSATISLAHSLGLKVVAEGVETAGQQDFLESRGCDFLQGYRFGKPLPGSEIRPYWRPGIAMPTGCSRCGRVGECTQALPALV